MRSWDVFLEGRKIDTVFYVNNVEAEEIKESLINHDNYNPDIEVKENLDWDNNCTGSA